MNKKFLIGIGIMFIGVLFIIIKLIIPNDKLSKLEKYNLLENESIKNEFKIENKKYILTTYYKNDSSYAYNNLLLKNKNDYYLLESMNKCDMSYYIKNNEIYIHCIGKKGDILKYTINDYKLEKDIMEFDYKDAPNISQIHITIDGADDDYIYLKSAVKINDSIKDGEFVKCSLSSKKCEYYNGNRVNELEVIKAENQNLNKFNIYLERNGRIIYLSSSLEEVYLNKNENKITLKDYISKSYQTLDDSINHVTDSMIKTETLRDGGTIIYKNDIFDITLVKCNTAKGNKDIFIGDSKMKFDDESMCNR